MDAAAVDVDAAIGRPSGKENASMTKRIDVSSKKRHADDGFASDRGEKRALVATTTSSARSVAREGGDGARRRSDASSGAVTRADADPADAELEALLTKHPRGKDKFDKIGKARAADEYLAELRPAVRAAMSRAMDLRVELANAEGKFERKSQAIRDKLREVEQGKASVETQLREALREQERLEVEAKRSAELARSSDRAKGEAERVKKEAVEEAERARAEADAATTRADGLKEDVERLEGEIVGLKRSLAEITKEMEEMKTANMSLQEDKSKLTMDIGTLRGEKSGLEMQVEALQQQAVEHANERETMREATDRLHNDLAKTRAEKDGSSQAMTRALEDAVEARAKAAKCASEAEAAGERARRAEDAYNHATADLQRARNERNTAQEQINTLNTEIELLKPQLAAVEEKLKTSAKRVETTERELRATTTSKEALDSKAENLMEALRLVERKMTMQIERANAADLECTRLNAELIAARASKDALDPKLSKLGNELADAQAEARQLKHEKERMENDISSMKHAAQSLEGENARLKSKCSTLAMERTTLEERLNSEVELRKGFEEDLRQSKKLLSKANQSAADERAKAMAAQDAIEDANSVRQQLVALQQAHTTQGDEMARCKMELANIVSDERSTSQLIARLQEVKNELASREEELHQALITRRHLHNTIQELKGNIRVFCRIRPPSETENSFGDDNMRVDRKGEFAGRRLEIAPPDAPKKYDFTFDRVFAKNGDHKIGDQQEVFDEVSLLVQSALDGYKVCIFTYGQTGSGKTYTMLGGKGDERGLIPRSMEQIFASQSLLEKKGMKVSITATLLEIYNEDIRDLLTTASGKTEHKIKHDDEGNTHVTNVTQCEVFSPADVESLMQQANAARAVAKTNMNDRSSRSHMVMRLCVDGVNEAGEPIHGALNLVDLAGSERLKTTGATGDRLKEAQAINSSLSSLGDVIFSLANKDKHIPFRNSKLTYLLKNSLGGDSKTLMLVNVSPALESAQETLCSLRFASKVNACALKSAKPKSSKPN